MTRHDPTVRIHHMLDHAREAVEMADGRTRDELDSDRMLVLALIRLLEVTGEAATHVPQAFRERHPDVPWREVMDLRNRLIHGYDTVNLDILWTIIQDDLPPLIEKLEEILDEEE